MKTLKHLTIKLIALAALALTAGTTLAQSIYEPYAFTTLVGQPGGPGSTDGAGGDVRFNSPHGVAVDSMGNIYVADSSNHVIRAISPAGAVTTLAGRALYSGSTDGTGSAARFFFPGGVAVHGADNVYVADSWNHTIRKVTPGGAVATLAGLARTLGSQDGTGTAARFNNPSGVAVDSDGNIYVADSGNHTIRKVTPTGLVTTPAGLQGSPGSADGTGSTARFSYPSGVAVDSAGNVYVADSGNHTLRKVTPTGVVTTLAGLAGNTGSGDGPGSTARFYDPWGIAVDSAGTLYVADLANHTIRMVTPGGVVTTLAGMAGVGGWADGAGSAVRFHNPFGVAVDSAGIVYVADRNNHTIRKGFVPAQFAAPTITVVENAASAQIQVMLSRAFPSSVTVDYTTRDGTATAGQDYAATDGTLTFLPGETSATFSVPLINDSKVEGPEEMILILSNPTGGPLPGEVAQAVVTITDNDSLALLAPPDVIENTGTVAVTVRRSGEVNAVSVFTHDGTARAGVDYLGQTNTLTFLPGETERTIAIPILNNARVDGERTFTVNLSDGSAFLSQAQVTIHDNDSLVLETLPDILENLGSVTLTVRRSEEMDSTLTWFTSDGTALAGVDYLAQTNTLTFLPGELERTITIPILNNARVDGDRTFTVNLTDGSGFQTQAHITIRDNDSLIVDVTSEVTENVGLVTVTVRWSGEAETTVSYFTDDGPPPDPGCPNCYPRSAVAWADYQPRAGVLTFAPGETNRTFTIPILDNGRVDGDRWFTVNVIPGTNSWRQTWVTIHDNETLVQVDPGFNPGISGTVNALALQPDGRILLGGMFDRVGDVPCTNLARLNPDGSLDASFAAATSSDWPGVSVLTLQTNGQVLVAGTFTAVNDIPLNGLARLNADGSVDPGFNSFAGVTLTNQVTDPWGSPPVAGINAILAQPDGKIVIGGTFDTVNGVGRTNLARLNVDGSLDTSFVIGTEYPSRVSTLARQPDGMILVGGTFTTVNGADHYGLARLNPDGSLDNTFFVGESVAFYDGPGSVNSIVVQPDGFILIAGQFTSVHGVGRNNLARLDSNGGLDMNFDGPLEIDSRVPIIAAASEGRVWAAEPRSHPGGGSFTLNRMNSDGTPDATYPPVQGGGSPLAMVVEPDGDILLWHGWHLWTPAGLTRFHANPSEPRVQFMSTQDPYSTQSSTDLVVNELSGIATVTIQRLGDTSSALTIDYATTDGTARAGLNYVATSGTLAFAPLETTGKTISIPILDDHAFSSDLSFRVTLSRPSVGLLGLNPLTITIRVSNYTPYTFTTLAGQAGSPGSADEVGSAARFNAPQGVAVDSTGNVYAADWDNHTIRKVTAVGEVTTLAGLAGSQGSADGTGSDARFFRPMGVAVDNAGNVYVADRDNHTIRKVTSAGVVTTLGGLAGNSGSADGTASAARFSSPSGVATDGAGNIYVADSFNHTIRKVTPAGVVTTLAGLAGSQGSTDGTGSDARFSGPGGVAVDSSGTIYVADTWNHTIRQVTSAGVVTTLAGMAQYDQYGSLVAGSADATGSAARFYYPRGVAVDSAGNVYVADQFNHTIRRVTPAGVVTTLAGMVQYNQYGIQVGGSADGTGSDVRFGGPSGLAVDSSGTVYVADSGNHTIRRGFPALGILSSGPGFGFNGGQFGFGLAGPSGRLVVVEASDDLADWLPIWTNTFTGGLRFTDPQSRAHSERFYRLRLP